MYTQLKYLAGTGACSLRRSVRTCFPTFHISPKIITCVIISPNPELTKWSFRKTSWSVILLTGCPPLFIESFPSVLQGFLLPQSLFLGLRYVQYLILLFWYLPFCIRHAFGFHCYKRLSVTWFLLIHLAAIIATPPSSYKHPPSLPCGCYPGTAHSVCDFFCHFVLHFGCTPFIKKYMNMGCLFGHSRAGTQTSPSYF